MINVYKILKNTKVEGPGVRFCIWVQGCRKHCKGCFAKETWDFDAGKKFTITSLYDLIKSQSGIEGVTFLGGEPFEQAKDLAVLAQLIKQEGLSIVCFSGYTLDELKAKNDSSVNMFLSYIDLLVDGGFEKDKFDLSRPWVGSANQHYHFLSNRYSPEILKEYSNKIEARISIDGCLEFNGMADFEAVKEKFCLQLGKNIVK